MTKRIYYVGAFGFPNGGAAARRILGNIKTIQLNGYEVTVVNGSSESNTELFDGIPVHSVSERPKVDAPIFNKLFKYLMMGANTIKLIKEQKQKPDAIILYSGYAPYLFKLLFYCKTNNIKLYFDCVEWYEPKRKYQYLFKPYYWNIEASMRLLIPLCDGVICISKFLNDYYHKKGLKVVQIPPTLCVNSLPEKDVFHPTKPYKLVYTGNPGHKDKLSEIVNIIKKFPNEFELHIAGIEGTNECNVFYYGEICHELAIKLVSSCHFSILFRPNNKVSKAGFSTKVVESMFCGTPVITNNTGDLSEYIEDNVNGYIFDGFSAKELECKLNYISLIDDINYTELSKNAKKTAFRYFKYERYKESFQELLNLC